MPGIKPEETAPAAPEGPEPRYIAETTLNVRSGAGTSAAILGTVDKDTTFPDAVREGDWIRFKYNGSDAYVSAAYVRKE